MVKAKACRKCRKILEDEKKHECPLAEPGALMDKSQFTTFWQGYVVIVNPEQSEMAKKMGIDKPGKYALRLSR